MIAKKTIITASIVLVVMGLVVWGSLALLEFLSWKTITFNLSSETKAITLYSTSSVADGENSPQVASREGTGTLRLKTGTYYAIPSGDDVADTSIPVIVSADTTEVNINPYYSEEYLAKSYTNELPAINSVIERKYKNIISQYTLKTGSFYHFGNWYSATLQKNSVEQGEGVDIYGIILRKENDTWNIVAPPKIVFAYKDYRSIPADVLYATNQSIGAF